MSPIRIIFSQVLTATALLTMTGCSKESIMPTKEELVVEGWISEGESPIVMVSTAVPTSVGSVTENDLFKYIAHFAKVTVNDGTKEYILIGRNDSRFIPPYIFTRDEMKGVRGRDYTVKVSYNGLSASASSRIEKPVKISRIDIKDNGDSTYSLSGHILKPESGSVFFKSFVWVEGTDDYWKPSMLGTFSRSFSDDSEFDIRPPGGQSNSGFHSGEKVHIRLCSIGEKMFNFWSSFDNSSTFAGNPLIPVSTNLPEAVSGAFGYWTGYGISDTLVVIP